MENDYSFNVGNLLQVVFGRRNTIYIYIIIIKKKKLNGEIIIILY